MAKLIDQNHSAEVRFLDGAVRLRDPMMRAGV